ncbi:MAG TPA: hypothetical protein VFW25_03820 [Silvibacterium sp.]|nr:hypothetical protein [Silvibacterium sp.]
MNQLDPNQLHALQAMLVFVPIVVLIFIVIATIPYWMIWKKAGFSPWFSLLMFVPMLNLIMLYVLAFSEWKVVPVAQPQYPYPYPPPSIPPQV